MAIYSPKNHPITETEFVAVYGEHPVTLEGLQNPITVNMALAMENSFCTAGKEARADKTARLSRLAGYVGREALSAEHQWLLPETQK